MSTASSVEGASWVELVARLSEGQSLAIVDDPDNPVNGRALLLAGDDQEQIGWVPDYLVEHFHDLRDLNGANPAVRVEHINGPDVAPHMRVLCRVTAPWPDGYQPFSSIEVQPIVTLSDDRDVAAGPQDVAECLPDLLPDSLGTGGTGGDEPAGPNAENPRNTRGKGTRRHRPGRGSSNS